MTKGKYSFDVLINGSSVKEYSGPEGLTYIEGKKGSEFTLRVQNGSGHRILAVITVDGLSVIDGKPASFNSQGYILDPWSTAKIPGWRLDDKEVAKFYFDNSSKSYAARTGKGNNVGVIGCAIFEEEYYVQPLFKTFQAIERKMDEIMPWPDVFPKIDWTYNTTHTPNDKMLYLNSNNTDNTLINSCLCSSSCNTSSSKQDAQQANQNIGTGFGKATEHKVTSAPFTRQGSPVLVIEINYDDRDGLKAKGVYLGPTNQVSAFPEETTYCKPPKGWEK